MTALYAILAVICLGGILYGAYLIGYDDGVRSEQMRHKTLDYIVIVYEAIEEANAREADRHALTHADMVQLEAAAKNNEKEKDNEDEE